MAAVNHTVRAQLALGVIPLLVALAAARLGGAELPSPDTQAPFTPVLKPLPIPPLESPEPTTRPPPTPTPDTPSTSPFFEAPPFAPILSSGPPFPTSLHSESEAPARRHSESAARETSAGPTESPDVGPPLLAGGDSTDPLPMVFRDWLGMALLALSILATVWAWTRPRPDDAP